MTCKTIALLRRRANLSHHAFVDYYETRHAPLILRVVPGIIEYRRNYMIREQAFVSAGAAPFDFDVVTELWWTDRAAYDASIAVATRDDIAAEIAADEANFLDRSGTRMFLVDETATAFP